VVKGEKSATIPLHSSKILCLVLSKDDRLVITGSHDATVKVTDLEQPGRTSKVLNPRCGPVTSLAITSDDEYLFTGKFVKFTIELNVCAVCQVFINFLAA